MKMSKDITMMDGEQVFVGDPVYCLCYGWGHVVALDYENGSLIAVVYRMEEVVQYAKLGLNIITDDFAYRTRTLYWDKPAEIIPPPKPKPKKKIKVWDWYIENEHGGVLRVYGYSETGVKYWVSHQSNRQKIDGTEREVEVVE